MSTKGDHLGSRPRNANKRWTPAEEAKLQKAFESGVPVDEIAKVHGRSAYAIRMRLERLDATNAKEVVEPVAAPEPITRKARPDFARAHARFGRRKLTVELVPESCWFSNVRSEVSVSDWQSIRSVQLDRANGECEVCGNDNPDKPLECHEVWHYDDARLLQTLVRMIALCNSCHEVKHFGRTGMQGRHAEAFNHMCRVNGWSKVVGQRHLDDAFKVWEDRSKKPWKLDISVLSDYGVTPPSVANRQVPAAVTRIKPATPRQPTTLVSIDEIARQLPACGRKPSQPLRARMAMPSIRSRADAKVDLDLRPLPALAPKDSPKSQWVAAGDWEFWWNGRQWTGDRKPRSRSAGWWPDPSGPGVRWWTGREWSTNRLGSTSGWVPLTPTTKTRFMWWDGTAFVELIQTMPLGAAVNAVPQNRAGRLVGIDVVQRERPALVAFRHKGQQQLMNFAFHELRKI